MSRNDGVTRRTVLQSTSLGIAGSGLAGLAGAATGTVRVNVGVDTDAARRAVGDAADRVIHEFAFDAMTVELPTDAVDPLRSRRDVRYLERDGRARAYGQRLPWGIDRIGADDVQEVSYTGATTDVAVVDTGIDPTHEDLDAQVGEGKAIVTCSSDCAEPWDDDNDHGTHVAGTVAAEDNYVGVLGVAPDTTLHAVKVLDQYGYGYWSDVAKGIEWVADQNYDVANMSLGGDSGSSTLKEAVEYADDAGILQVAAAGNSGPCSDCVGYPAAYSETIAVSATNDSDDLASFSSTGPEVDFAAPGANVESTVPGDSYAYYDGTSMAAPHVSGALATMTSAQTSGDRQQERQEALSELRSAAEDVGLSGNEQGDGLVDLDAAILVPDVASRRAEDVTSQQATLVGDLTDMGGSAEVDVRFQWGYAYKTVPDRETDRQAVTSTGEFSATVDLPEPDTDYKFRAVALTKEGDRVLGDFVTFTAP